MIARTEFEAINNEIAAIEKQEKELRQHSNELTKQRDVAFRKLLIEEKLLSKKEWMLEADHYAPGTCTLVCADKSSDWPELSNYAETNYHCSFQLEGKDFIRFNDRTISIRINDINHLKNVIDTYGLRVSFETGLSRTLKKMSDSIEVLREWENALDNA